MKFILMAVIVVGVSYVGYGISRYYRKRKRYFSDLILLSERLSVDISFTKDYLVSICSRSVVSFGSDLKNTVNSYIEFLKNNETELTSELIFKKSSLIKEEEKEVVFLFFKSLGRLDASNQISEIENFKNKFIAYKNEAEIEDKKFGSLSFKLALLLALLIVILLI
jgi:stage III sporulation protein AB